MPKRPASTGILCPGCLENFDTEKHIPMIGSCGDSVCAVCVNEKKIKTCPVCNRRSFAWKQSNNLAMELLAAMAEKEAADSKKSKLDVAPLLAPGKPVPAILDPKNLPFLAEIVNRLNPTTFLKLARTCKTLKNYCFNCKDIKIIYKIHSIAVTKDFDDFGSFGFCVRETEEKWYEEPDEDGEYFFEFLSMDYAGYRHGFLNSAAGRKKLLNYPFEFRLKELNVRRVHRPDFDEAFFTFLRTFFAEFPIKTVSSLLAWPWEKDLDVLADSREFMKFLKDFRFKEVNFVDVVSISSEEFADFIKKFADFTDKIHWHLRVSRLKLHEILSFVNVLPFNYKGPLPEEHPIIFVKDDEPQECWILRKDGKVMKCITYDDGFFFSLCFPRNYPPCLRR